MCHCRNGKLLCCDLLRLCRAPAFHSCSQAQRLLPCVATAAQASSSSGGPPRNGQHQLSIRRQLQTGGDLTRAALTRYKVGQLREAHHEEGLSTIGLKAHLVERLCELVETLDPHTAQLESGPVSVKSVQQSNGAQLSQDVLTASQHRGMVSPYLEAEPMSTVLAEEAATSSSSTSAPATSQADHSLEQTPQTDSSSKGGAARDISTEQGVSASGATDAREAKPVAQSSSQRKLSIRRELQAGTRLTPATLSRYRVAALREALEAEGLSTLGTKSVLVARVWELVGALKSSTATFIRLQEDSAEHAQHGSGAQPLQDMSILSVHKGSDGAVSEAQLDFKRSEEDATSSQSTPEHPSAQSMASSQQPAEAHSSSAVVRDLDTPERAANKTGASSLFHTQPAELACATDLELHPDRLGTCQGQHCDVPSEIHSQSPLLGAYLVIQLPLTGLTVTKPDGVSILGHGCCTPTVRIECLRHAGLHV